MATEKKFRLKQVTLKISPEVQLRFMPKTAKWQLESTIQPPASVQEVVYASEVPMVPDELPPDSGVRPRPADRNPQKQQQLKTLQKSIVEKQQGSKAVRQKVDKLHTQIGVKKDLRQKAEQEWVESRVKRERMEKEFSKYEECRRRMA